MCERQPDFTRVDEKNGPDITADFWEASFDLFRDRSTMQARFVRSDIFDNESMLFQQNTNFFDVLICGDFFHLFDWQRQVAAGVQVVRLGRARPGTVIIGKQVGSTPPMDIATTWGKGEHMFLHDQNTFRQMWSEVEEQTQTKWTFIVRDAVFGEGGFWSPKECFEWMGEPRHGIQFVMTRL